MRKSTNLSPQATSSLSQVRIRELDHLRSEFLKNCLLLCQQEKLIITTDYEINFC